MEKNKKNIKYYSLDSIKKLGANINLIVGERSNGKSYAVKHKQGVLQYIFGGEVYKDYYYDKGNIIKKCIAKNSRFILMRRWKEEINVALIEQYFTDVDIYKITEGKYNSITVYRKKIYLTNIVEGKPIRGEYIGYVVSLSTEQNYAGGSYLDVTDIIFEEFMSRGAYLAGEPDKLMNFYSTIDRKRGTTKMWLLGNSITRVCPYFTDWELDTIIREIKQGEIRIKWLPTGDKDEKGIDIEVKLAFEYCEDTGSSSFVIGKHKDMLNGGTWQTDPQPHLPKSLKNYKILYKIMFYYKKFYFQADYIMDKETYDCCWFIYPGKNKINKKTLVFSDEIRPSLYWQKDIYNPLIRNLKLRNLLQTFKESNIFYSSDLCGTDFKQVIDFTIRK